MFNVQSVNRDNTNEGVWKDYNGGQFLIAHTSNLTFQRSFAKLQQPHIRKIERGTLDPKVSHTIMCKSMAEGLLLDWKNVGDGKQILEYSKEAAVKVLLANEDLREFVMDVASNLENYRQEEIEESGNA